MGQLKSYWAEQRLIRSIQAQPITPLTHPFTTQTDLKIGERQNPQFQKEFEIATMEKRHRRPSASADELLSSAPALSDTKSGKSYLKAQIFSLSPSSDIVSSLSTSIHLAVSHSIHAFKASFHSSSAAAPAASPSGHSSRSPPSKGSSRLSPTVRPTSTDGAAYTERSDPQENLVHLKNLRAYAFIAQLCVSHPKKLFTAEELLPAIQSLHDSLVLFEADQALLSQVASLCEEWWKEKLPGRENLVSQSVPFLLSRSLTDGKKADVRRIFGLRETFLLFDYDDESIEDMRTLLVRCVITPVFLKMEEGKKFVAFILGLNSQLTKDALSLIKSQIPFGRKSVLEAYADILFRAWRGLGDTLRKEIEEGLFPGLIEGAIYANSRSLAASARRVLCGFIEQRATTGVEKLLFRLVEPLLFRSLQVANSNVRQNALYLFLDMFPLEDPDATKEIKDSLLDRQFFLLQKMLLDDCPEIRSVAVEGSCRILHLFWEVIPSSKITKLLAKIVDSMSHDACSEVRLSTINGIIYMLDNPQTHDIMKVLIPRLGSMICDPSLSVRVAVIELLLAVHNIRSFPFNKVVDLDSLLSSLANDHPRVAHSITKLLIPSYFPSKLATKEACIRCIALIKRSPVAGARFCEYAFSEGSSSKSLVELCKICLSLSLSPKGLSVEQINGLLTASSNICLSLSSHSSSKRDFNELLSADKLKCLLTTAASDSARTALLNIASVLPEDKIAGLHDELMGIVSNSIGLSENIERQELIKAAHKLIYSCNWSDEMFDQLTSILCETASHLSNELGLGMVLQGIPTSRNKKVRLPKKNPSRGRGAGRKSQHSGLSNVVHDLDIAAAAAWQVNDLLFNESTRKALLQYPSLEETLSALSLIFQVHIQHSIERELFDVTPIMAYTVLAKYMSLPTVGLSTTNNNGEVSTSDLPQTCSSQEAILDKALNHILFCADNLISRHTSCKANRHDKEEVQQSQKSKRRKTLDGKLDITKGGETMSRSLEVNKIYNLMKLFSIILKFMIDYAMVRLNDQNHIRCLNFISSYIQHVVITIRRHEKLQFTEEILKDIISFTKSSFTHAAKLLHLVLSRFNEATKPPSEAFYLANDLLYLITSLESYLGSRYVSQIVSSAKPWISVLILGLGCNQLAMTEKEGQAIVAYLIEVKFPMWITILGKVQFPGAAALSQSEDSQSPELEALVLQNLMEAIIVLLKKGDGKIFVAVGGVLLAALEVALKRKDFALVLGLVNFTCTKLLANFLGTLDENGILHCSLKEVYISVERILRDHHIKDEERQWLESAKSLIKPILLNSP